MKVTIIVNDIMHDIECPPEWLEGRRGWELIGSKGYDTHAATLSRLSTTDDEHDAVPADAI